MDNGTREPASVTGTARGSLGTSTALEDTQEWEVPQDLGVAEPGREPDPEPGADPSVDPAHDPGPQPGLKPASEAAPIAVASGVASTPNPARSADPVRKRSARKRGLHRNLLIAAAAAIGAVAVGFAVGSSGLVPDGPDEAVPAEQSTLAPTEAAPREDDEGEGEGTGGGNGKGKGGGRGNGNGRGGGGGD